MKSRNTLEAAVSISDHGKFHTDKKGDKPPAIEAAPEPVTALERDYMTLLFTTAPSNKEVRFLRGELRKTAPFPIYDAKAYAIHVPDVEAMRELLLTVAAASNAVLIAGFVPDAETDNFRVMSKKAIEEKTKKPYEGGWVDIDGEQVIARTKDNFVASSWWQIDRDRASGLPDALDPDTDAGYVAMIDRIIPGFIDTGYVKVSSTTGRVLVDGVPMDSTGSRYWFQVENPDDISGFGARMKLHAAAQGLGFMKYDKNGKGVLWTVADCSVFSPERVIFDGQPYIPEGQPRLSLRDPDLVVVQGGRVNSELVPSPSLRTVALVKREFNVKVSTRGGIISMNNEDYLRLDTQVETYDHGIKTVAEFMESGETRWRCQATFRESGSWNGALKLRRNGMPYLQDFGGETIYSLNPADRAAIIRGVFANA
jgi:hypothetical protein